MIDYHRIGLRLHNPEFGLLSGREDPWIRNVFDICVYDDGYSSSIKIGTMQVSKLSMSDVNRRGISLLMAFDDYSAETLECYNVVFDEDGNMRKPFWHEYYGQEEYLANDFHFLERIEIGEEHKGHGIVAVATQIYFENFANGNDVAYFKAFPLQHELSCDSKSNPYKRAFKGSLKNNQTKLCKYYERLGFRRIDKTEHFFFVVDDFLSKRAMMGV